MVLILLTILGGWLGADYVADPESIAHPWRVVVAGIAAVVVFLALSTLTQLIYILAFPVSLPSTKRFLMVLGNFSAVGAILGTALGFRMGMHLFDGARRDPSRYGLAELLDTIGDGVTLMTLIMIALCWPFAVALGRELAQELRKRGQSRGTAQVFAFMVLAVGNLLGLNAAAFAYQLLAR